MSKEAHKGKFAAAVYALGLIVALAPATASAATIAVDSSADNGTGCTLRDAIVSTNNNADEPGCTNTGAAYASGGADTVNVPASAGPVIQLTSQLAIDQTTGSLDIKGPGADQLDVRGGATFRVISITGGGGSAGATTIEDLTVSNGTALDGVGGGIKAVGTQDLAVFNSVVKDNTATQTTTNGAASATGGGIYTDHGLTVDTTTIANNHALAATSGGMLINFATAAGGGIAGAAGGAFNFSITASTISGNDASPSAAGPGANGQAAGGGISQSSLGTWSIRRSTISGNVASTAPPASFGGGVYGIAGGGTTYTGVTITGNTASSGASVYRSGPATFQDTILSNPQVGANCSATGATGGFNIESDSTCFTLNGTNDQMTDPMISPTLAFNGGATKTHALLPLSPAIDKGSAFSLSNDQRGFSRTVDLSTFTNATGGDGTDVGAFELNDPDLDGLESYQDNCPNDANAGQENSDADLEGDACDIDDDNDGVNDGSDSCSPGETSWTSSPATDNDADGCRDAGEDGDDDNDGVVDTSDGCPLQANATPTGCPASQSTTSTGGGSTTTTGDVSATGQQAAALKKCKKKKTSRARKKCKKKANLLPV